MTWHPNSGTNRIHLARRFAPTWHRELRRSTRGGGRSKMMGLHAHSMKETSAPPHTGSEPFTPTVGVKNRYSVLARGRFSPARLAKAPTLGSGARVDSQTALCRAGTGTIPARIRPISAGVRLNEGAYHGANRPKSARNPPDYPDFMRGLRAN